MSEWKRDKLENLTLLIKDGTHGTHKNVENGIPLLSAKDVENDQILIPSDCRRISVDEYDAIHANYEIEKNDLLLTIVGTIGRVAIVRNTNQKFTFQRSVGIIRVDKKKVNPLYSFHYFTSEEFQRSLDRSKNASAQGGVYLGEIAKLNVEFPSDIDEQRKIARILSTADAVIEKTRAAIAKYKAVKQGMLHDLFTRGIDPHTGTLRPKPEDAPELYWDSPLGKVPKAWDVKSLEEITDYVDYRGKTPPKSEFGVFLVTARNIKEGFIDYEISKEFIRADAFESAMSRGKAKLGDVLITTEAPLGNVAQVDREDIALAQRVIKYRGFAGKLNNDFLARFLMSDTFQCQLFSEATGSTVLGIKGSRLHKLKVIVPQIDKQNNIDEQKEISKRLSAIDAKIHTEQNYLAKWQSIKAGLMSDLLSGKKPVTVDESAPAVTEYA